MIEQVIAQAMETETLIDGMVFRNEEVGQICAHQVVFERVKFENCRFLSCDFSGAEFRDIEFVNCDLSNSNFTKTYWKQGEINRCKAQGTEFQESAFHLIGIKECNMDYANFSLTSWDQVTGADSTFSSATMMEAKWKKVLLSNSQFHSTDFYKTLLAGVDFSSCQISQLMLSDDLRELKGAKVNILQAAELARFLGIVIVS